MRGREDAGRGERTRGPGPRTKGLEEAVEGRGAAFDAPGGGGRRGCRWGEAPAARRGAPAERAADCSTRGSGCPRPPGSRSRNPRARGPGRPRQAGLRRLLLLLGAAASRACAGLAWAPGPQPARARRGGPQGPWGPRSWALAGAQPPPHAARGPGVPRRPPEPNAGEGGVPASGERAPAPAPASARCPPGRKGGNRSSITAAGPG